MQLLSGAMRSYPWGSHTAIAELRGHASPSDSPEAELWYGAHPGDPSTLHGSEPQDTKPLDQAIAADPEYHLGARVRREFGDTLPFLLKILAAGEPLSLQAHPSRAQAQEGFARENAAGISLDAPERNYKDDNHKPELIVALTDFQAMTGFRPLARTLEIAAALNCPELDRYISMLDVDNEDSSIRALFTTWIAIPVANRTKLIDAMTAAARAYVARPDAVDWIADTLNNILLLDERYPGDSGVLGAFLLNKINLKPGEAIYLDAGELHAYVHGLGIEIMANSDNVLRGGLTTKHVDVPELVRVLNFTPLTDPSIRESDLAETTTANRITYPVPINEFALSALNFDGSGEETVEWSSDGPSIVLCTGGELHLTDSGSELVIHPGEAVWIPAANDPVTIRPGGGAAQAFVASV